MTSTTPLAKEGHDTRLQVVRVDCGEALDALRPRWDEVYVADAKAHIFVSWSWLRAWFDVTPHRWFVLAARPNEAEPFVAFLPLADTAIRWAGATLRRELWLAGKPLADYTGLVCLPSYESAAVDAFAQHIRHELHWDRFQLSDVVDARVDALLSRLRFRDTEIIHDESLACPRILLPENWDSHLGKSMSAKSRYDVRRAFKNAEAAAGFRLTEASPESFDGDLDTFLTLWDARWGTGRPRVLDMYRHIFRRAFDNGSLWLRIVWDGDEPMAVLAAFVDSVRRTVYQHIMAFDRKFAKRSPGRALVGYTIRDAIERGMDTYDFLLGDKEYKYSFGAKAHHTSSAVVVRRSVRGTVGELLLRSRSLLKKQQGRLGRRLSSVRSRLLGRDRIKRPS